MANEEIKARVADLRDCQQRIQSATTERGDGWRQTVVAGRRAVANALGALSTLIASQPPTDRSDAFRRAVSRLRAALAEHQALWPAVAIAPTEFAYQTSVARVRAAYGDLDTALAALDRPAAPDA